MENTFLKGKEEVLRCGDRLLGRYQLNVLLDHFQILQKVLEMWCKVFLSGASIYLVVVSLMVNETKENFL